jgi:hypothetical protein
MPDNLDLVSRRGGAAFRTYGRENDTATVPGSKRMEGERHLVAALRNL